MAAEVRFLSSTFWDLAWATIVKYQARTVPPAPLLEFSLLLKFISGICGPTVRVVLNTWVLWHPEVIARLLSIKMCLKTDFAIIMSWACERA